MQHLLNFIQEHTLEDQLYFVASCPAGALELTWRRNEARDHWQVRPYRTAGPAELVPRGELIHSLQARDADMAGVKRELHAMLAALIAFADMVLREANQQLGPDLVERFVRGQRDFLQELQAAVEQLAVRPAPSMELIEGGGAETRLRAGHLSLVR